MDKLYGFSVSGYGIYSIEERQNRIMNVMLRFLSARSESRFWFPRHTDLMHFMRSILSRLCTGGR
jgi:hypothetical protein